MVETSLMVVVVIALSQVVKQLEMLEVKYIPILNLFFGVVLCLIYEPLNVKDSIFQGLVVGLSASGLFSSSKNTIANFGKGGAKS